MLNLPMQNAPGKPGRARKRVVYLATADHEQTDPTRGEDWEIGYWVKPFCVVIDTLLSGLTYYTSNNAAQSAAADGTTSMACTEQSATITQQCIFMATNHPLTPA
ncbi:hypothetical protein [Leeia sp.]|uniref:hypothetical protein n=1 Tax=Leeia sp. TaxID=2884678 RepID=UPI0035B3E0E2